MLVSFETWVQQELLYMRLGAVLLRYRNNKRYVHYRSVYNFIAHLGEFGNVIDSNRAVQLIEAYIEDLRTIRSLNSGVVINLYKNHIKPLGALYEDRLGFSMNCFLLSLVIDSLPFYGLLFLLKAPALSYFLIAAVLLGYFGFLLYIRRRKLVYGFFW